MTERYEDNVVCHLCFRDKALRKFIREEGKRGRCPWCERTGFLVPLRELSDPIREVASLYVPVEGPEAHEQGETISFLLDDEWGVFDEALLRDDLAQRLAVAILYADLGYKDRVDYSDYEGFFRPEENWLENRWHEKVYDAFIEGRTDADRPSTDRLGHTIDERFPDQIEIAFEDLATRLPAGEVLYRARIHKDRGRKIRFEKRELGAPPPEDAASGRANRKGEPVLYLAANRSTALAEVRAWKGMAVAVGTVTLKRALLLVNLKRPHPLKSPFFVDMISWRLQVAVLLHRLGEDMSRPVFRQEDEKLYIPTQFLAWLIKSNRYDGFIYPSAMGPGNNIALFNPDDAEITDISYRRIRRVAHFSETISPFEDVYDEGPYDGMLAD